MKMCEVCGCRPAAFSLPGEDGKKIDICDPCTKELFDKVMNERKGATLQ